MGGYARRSEDERDHRNQERDNGAINADTGGPRRCGHRYLHMVPADALAPHVLYTVPATARWQG